MRPGRGAPSHRDISSSVRQRLRCPVCRATLEGAGDELICTGASCRNRFPIVHGVPVLVNENQSVFSINDFVERRNTTSNLHPSRVERLADRLLGAMPAISLSIGSDRNFAQFHGLLLKDVSAPKVLVVGGSVLGQGMKALARDPRVELVATDVTFGPLTAIICDAHDIPFDDVTFDGVVVQAVLEHVMDPERCVGEIHRVLKQGGLVYAETPFMQQIHMGRYDFTRFSHSGHRRLFRQFSEIASGPIGGPGMALAWSYQYFFLSFTTSRAMRGVIRAFTALTSFCLKYADYYLIRKAGAIDAASGFFFMGRKEGHTLTDRELASYYRGAIST
jgi:SAM-dependent methyltransferase